MRGRPDSVMKRLGDGGRLTSMSSSRPSEAELIEAMAASFENLLSVFRAAQGAHFPGDFADPSPARYVWDHADPKLQHLLQEAYRTGMVRWHTIQDHCHGFVEVVRAGLPSSALSLSRAMAEGAARAWYNYEPEVKPIDLVTRLINDRLHASFEDERLYAGILPSEKHPPDIQANSVQRERLVRARITQVQQNILDLKTEAKSIGVFGLKEGRGKAPYVGGIPVPNAMPLIGRLLESASRSDPFYRLSSGIDHGSLHTMVRMFDFGSDQNGRPVTRRRPMKADELAVSCAPSVFAVLVSAGVFFAQAGWETDGIEDAAALIGVAWNPPRSQESIDDSARLDWETQRV
jgi:hypothetical protein